MSKTCLVDPDEFRSESSARAYSATVQRPNKLSMVLKQGMMGATIVSDGENLMGHRQVCATEKYRDIAAINLDHTVPLELPVDRV